MSRGFYFRTIRSNFKFKIQKSMIEKVIKNQSSSVTQKVIKKSTLDFLTEENDLLLKSLKKPSGSYRANK